jgi:hypothetical protein
MTWIRTPNVIARKENANRNGIVDQDYGFVATVKGGQVRNKYVERMHTQASSGHYLLAVR